MQDVIGGRSLVELSDGLALSVVEHAPEDRERADGASETFVLVHGLASNARTWDGVGNALARAGHRAWAVDLRGHGRSAKPDDGYDVGTVAEDVCELIAAVAGGPVVLAGQSWGGNVVIEAAARCPERIGAVAGVDGGVIHLREAYPDWDQCARELAPPPLAGMPADDMQRHLRSAHPDWPASGIEGTLANFEVRADGTIAPWLTRERHMRVLRGLWEHEPAAAYPDITMPVLLIEAGAGRHRRMERVRHDWFDRAASDLVRGQVVRLPDADHDVHAQHPQLSADLLLDLAERMRAGESGRG